MKRNELLNRALNAFIHYGFRKATMDDVAAAVGMSRPGLYKAFGSKGKLFRAAIENALEVSTQGVLESLSDETLTVEERVLKAFDWWSGRHIDALRSSPHTFEVIATVSTELGERSEQAQETMIQRVAKCIESLSTRKGNGTPEEVAQTLMAVAMGLVHTAPNHGAFLDQMRVAIKVVC